MRGGSALSMVTLPKSGGRERTGEEIADVERQRVDAHVMSVYVLLDWTF